MKTTRLFKLSEDSIKLTFVCVEMSQYYSHMTFTITLHIFSRLRVCACVRARRSPRVVLLCVSHVGEIHNTDFLA